MSLDDFGWRFKFQAVIQNGAAFLAENLLRHKPYLGVGVEVKQHILASWSSPNQHCDIRCLKASGSS